MAKSLGSFATLDASNDGVSWTRIGKVWMADFPVANNAIDSTDNDDNGYKSNLYGDQQVKTAWTARYDPLDAGQSLVLNNLATKVPTYFRYRSRGAGTGLPQVTGQFVLTDGYPKSEHEKTQDIEIKASSTGPLTVGVQ